MSKLSQCYLDKMIKNVYIPKLSCGRRSVSFQSMPEYEDKGKNVISAYKSHQKKKCVLSSDKVLGLKVKEQYQPGTKQRLKGQLCISEGCKMISHYLLLAHLFKK